MKSSLKNKIELFEKNIAGQQEIESVDPTLMGIAKPVEAKE